MFYDVQSGLPRQGPGDEQSTRTALALCTGLPAKPLVLDIGCGPGAQTIVLAQALPDASITAIDNHLPYLEELESRAHAAGLEGRIVTEQHDMGALPYEPASFDLIWAEGSAYSIGIANALSAWQPLLKPGAYLAFTELVWLASSPPAEAVEFFDNEYPAMTTSQAIAGLIVEHGYELSGRFTLPDSAWWDDYYTPLSEKFPRLIEKYAGDEAGLAVVEMAQEEQRIRRDFGSSYGYEFFVARQLTEQCQPPATNGSSPESRPAGY